MRHYVMADPHGFYEATVTALREKGFFDDEEPHKLVLCGDAMDRGREPLEMQKFLLEQKECGNLIFIRGNHEDLLVDMIDNWYDYFKDIVIGRSHHLHNGTVRTALDLTGYEHLADAILPVLQQHETEPALSEPRKSPIDAEKFLAQVRATPFYSELIPSSIDYYETKNYIFVHGWIPCSTEHDRWGGHIGGYAYDPDWRKASDVEWRAARWLNGIDCAETKVIEPNKTIVCGHWHCSYGHWMYGYAHDEFGEGADFTPFYDDGIIALDACTAASGKVNCIVLEDEPI